LRRASTFGHLQERRGWRGRAQKIFSERGSGSTSDDHDQGKSPAGTSRRPTPLPRGFCIAAAVAAISHLYGRMHRDPWRYYEFDDCPPPHIGRKVVEQPPARARLTVELPPCKPHGGINTDWSGNKCATRREHSSQVALSTPQTRPEAPSKEQIPKSKADAGTSGQSSGNDASGAIPTPQARPETSKTQQQTPNAKANVGTVGQSSGENHTSMAGTIGFDVAVALSLALAFFIVRRFVLNLLGDAEPGVERDDAV